MQADMKETWNRRIRGRLACSIGVALVTLSAHGAVPHGAMGGGVGSQLVLGDSPLEERPWAERGDALPQIHARFEGLRGEAFQSRASETVHQIPREAIGAILLRAAPVPPGLTAAASTRRTAMRAEALALLEAGLTGESAALWQVHIAGFLALPPASAGPRVHQVADDLACATFGALSKLVLQAEQAVEVALELEEPPPDLQDRIEHAGRLREVVGEFSITMATALAEDHTPRVRLAAGHALVRLYGLRFTTLADFAAYGSEGSGGQIARQALRKASALAQARLLDVIELDPARATDAWADASLHVRRRTPEILREAVVLGSFDRTQAVELLFDGLVQEVDGHAFRAQLDALLTLLADVPVDDPEARRLRGELSEMALQGQSHLAWSVLHGLTRVPLARTSNGPTVDRVTRLFDQLVNDWRPLDADVVVQGLADLRHFADRVGIQPEFDRVWRGLRFLLVDYGHTGSLAVRRAAARTAGLVAGSSQVEDLLAVLEAGPEPELVYELVSALSLVAGRLEDEPEVQAGIVRALVPQLEHPSLDVRRLTLDVLANEALSQIVVAETALPARLLTRMTVEESTELVLDQLRLLARFERPRLVPELLATPAVAKLVLDPKGLEELTLSLRRLSGGDPRRIVQAARGLIELDQEQTFVARKERALQLVFGLSEGEARNLEPRVHEEVLGWLRELRAVRGAAVGNDELWASWCLRALGVHMALAWDERGEPSCALVHLEALLRSDLLGITRRDPDGFERFGIPEQLVEQEALAALFSKAIELCAAEGAGRRPLAELRRDKARMLLVCGANREAFELYVALVPELDRPEEDHVLDPSDLRAFVRLLGDDATPRQRRLGFLAARAVIEVDSWGDEPAGVRHDDLGQLMGRAVAWGDREGVDHALGLVQDLPDEGASLENLDGGPAAQWAELAEHPEWHAELLRRRETLRRRAESLGPPPQKPTPPPQGDGGE